MKDAGPRVDSDLAARVLAGDLRALARALTVVEIGDGQVSDLVAWSAAAFASLWANTQDANTSLPHNRTSRGV